MPAEFDVYGVYLPTLLIFMLAALALHMGLQRVLARLGVYNMVWHRALFDIALYILLLGALSGLTRWYFI